MKEPKLSISIIIPVFNEEGSIADLHHEIKSVCIQNNYVHEIVIIDDGSTDGTYEVLRKLSPIKIIKFRKNFGQTSSLDAGIKAARYPYVITIDGDGQNDPKDIPVLIQNLEEKRCDVISGWRKKRKDNFFKKIVSKGAYLLRCLLINDGIHDSGCTLKIYRKECFKHVSLYGEMHRFIPAILKIKGFKIGEIEVNHRPRTTGKTKYNWRRSVKGFLDMISVWFWNKYAVRPLHLVGGVGGISLFAGIISSIITTYKFLIGEDLSSTVYPLLTVFLLFTGINLFILGLMSDILVKTYFQSTHDVQYLVEEITEL